VHLDGFLARRLILFKIRIHTRNNMRYWMRYKSRPERVLPCLSVRLPCLISYVSLLIYPAAFVSSMLRADRVISTENIISRNRIRAQIHTASGRIQDADLRPQYNVPSSALLFITPSVVAIHFCYCDIWLHINPNIDVYSWPHFQVINNSVVFTDWSN